MKCHYCHRDKLLKMITSNQSNNSQLLITSAADICEIIENIKKHGVIEPSKFLDYQLKFDDNLIFTADLNCTSLVHFILENSLWEKYSNSKSNPMEMIRHITLRRYDNSVWWDEEVITELWDYLGN